MIALIDGEVETESKRDDDQILSLKDACDDNVEYPVEGESLVARHALSSQVKEDDLEQQRENIFHTRCHINNKVCIMIIDRGSYTNVASTTLVEKLNLPPLKHPRPYKLQWLNDCGEVKVNKQVLVSFQFGGTRMKYFVMLFQCMWVAFYWAGLGNLTERSIMMGSRIGILL